MNLNKQKNPKIKSAHSTREDEKDLKRKNSNKQATHTNIMCLELLYHSAKYIPRTPKLKNNTHLFFYYAYMMLVEFVNKTWFGNKVHTLYLYKNTKLLLLRKLYYCKVLQIQFVRAMFPPECLQHIWCLDVDCFPWRESSSWSSSNPQLTDPQTAKGTTKTRTTINFTLHFERSTKSLGYLVFVFLSIIQN